MNNEPKTERLDWRVHAAATTTTAIPATFPGGPSHPAGSTIVMSSTVEVTDGNVAFIAPSAVALALNIAAMAALDAEKIHLSLRLIPTVAPAQPTSMLVGERLGDVFDYFEKCLLCAILAYNAIEAYCNFKVAYLLSGTLPVINPKTKVSRDLAGPEIEREPVGTKLDYVLPTLVGCASPKGTTIWQRFRELENVRNASVHFKSHHQWTGQAPFGESPYAFFVTHRPRRLVDNGIAVIEYFGGSHEAHWLAGAKGVLNGKSAQEPGSAETSTTPDSQV